MEFDQGETEYSHLDKDEFLDVLQKRLPDRSWTLDQWLELERRGFEIVDQNPDLKAAIKQEQEKLNAAFQKALEPARHQITSKLEPLQRQLADLVRSVMPKAELTELIPGVAISALIDPKFVQLGRDAFPPRVPAAREQGLAKSGQPAAAVIDEIAALEELKMRDEAEVRRAQLETATLAAVQVKVMERVEAAVKDAAKHEWYDWAVLALAAVAAIASVIAILQ